MTLRPSVGSPPWRGVAPAWRGLLPPSVGWGSLAPPVPPRGLGWPTGLVARAKPYLPAARAGAGGRVGTGWQRDAGKVRALPCHPEPPTSKPGDLSNAAALAQDGETHSWERSGEHEGGSTHPWTHWRDGADPPAPAHGDGVMLPGGIPVPLPAARSGQDPVPHRSSVCPRHGRAGLSLSPGLWSVGAVRQPRCCQR